MVLKMNKKLNIIILWALISLNVFGKNVSCDTTIGSSTFPANEGDIIKWKYTYPLAQASENSGFNYVIESIRKINIADNTFLSINITVESFNGSTGEVENIRENHHYLDYNATLSYLLISNSFGAIYLWIAPSPLNIDLICLAANYWIISQGFNMTCSYYHNILSITNFNDPYTIKYNSTFNDHGIMIKHEWFLDNELSFRLELITDVNSNKISSGFHFLIFLGISLILSGFYLSNKLKRNR